MNTTEKPNNTPGKAGLKEVAELAGVGYGTASRSLTGKGYVSEVTRQKVLSAARDLGYIPNRLAKALREARTTLIGVILPDLRNEFYSEATHVIQRDLNRAGYQMLVAAASTSDEQNAAVEALVSQRVAGLIQVPVIGAVAASGIPTVQLTRGSLGDTVPLVACDDESGFYELATILVGKGHQRVAAFLGEEELSTTRARRKGIQRAVESLGAEVQFYYGTYSADSGSQLAEELLSASWPDALIVASPRLMAGVAQTFTQRDVNVPGDIALAGYDDPEWYSFFGAGITTFVPPHEEMGSMAASVLLSLIEDPELMPESLNLPGQITLRGSL